MSSEPEDDSSSAFARLVLPAGLRMLCVSAEAPSLGEATRQLEAAGCSDPRFFWAMSSQQAIGCLRRQPVDCVIIEIDSRRDATEAVDPIALANALRAAGCDESVVLLCLQADDLLTASALQIDVDVFVSPDGWNSAAFAAVVARARERAETRRELRRLKADEELRLARERDEAEQLLSQNNQLVAGLKELLLDPELPRAGLAAADASVVPPQVRSLYEDLLKRFVMAGTTDPGSLIGTVAGLLVAGDVSPREAMRLHLECVDSVIRGLGRRSARHVLARTDLLAVELLAQLGELYRNRAVSTAGGPPRDGISNSDVPAES